MRHPFRFALGLLPLLFALDASAVSSGRVTAGPLSYELIDLDPDDGIAPSIQFTADAATPARGVVYYTQNGMYTYLERFGEGSAAHTVSVQQPFAGATGTAAGAGSGASSVLELAAYADGTGAGDVWLSAFIDRFAQGFVLSPHTGLVASSVIDITADVEHAGESFDGWGQLTIGAPDLDGHGVSYVAAESDKVTFAPGEANRLDTQLTVSRMYWNERGEAVSGTVGLQLLAYAVSPVPEPGSFALAATGAAVLFAYRGRRRARRALSRGA